TDAFCPLSLHDALPIADAASASMLALLRGMLATFGKETTLAAVKAAAESLAQEDFATETTLAALLSAVGNLATEATLSGVKSAVDTLAGTGADGAKKVTLSGRVGALRNTISTGSKTVTSTAAEIFAGSSRLAGRHAMVITNVRVGHVYIRPSGVTTGNGFPLFPGDTVRLD